MLEQSGKFMVAAFAVLAVAGVAGCGGSSSPAGAGAQGAQTPVSGSTAPSASTQRATTAPSASAHATAAATSKAKSTGSSGSTTATGSSSRAGKAPGKPSGFTRAGAYTYDLSGSAKQPIGGAQTISGTQSYKVDPPSGDTQHSATTDQQGSQDMTLAVSSGGLYVRDIHIKQQGFDEDFKPVGTALFFPASYHTGSQWSWRAKSTDGKYSISVSSKVSGTSSVTVGGTADKALVLDSMLHITGSGFDVTSTQRDWVSTTYALILQEHSVTKGTAYGASFSSDVTRKLRSTTPA